MDNLWKKESNRAGAQYVDLFAAQHGDEQMEDMMKKFANLTKITRHKDNRLSTTYLEEGDHYFQLKDWSNAMESYNRSLCYAQVGSENEALAYSNRSACFFDMAQYEEALTDIELAKRANLREHLIPELEKRQQECQKLMAADQNIWISHDLKLSYEPNNNYPCLANVVEIKYNSKFGRHLVATTQIPDGKFVLVEKEFVGATMNSETLCCDTCRQVVACFIACPKCPDVIFCNRECMDRNFIHKYECGTSLFKLNFETRSRVRSILTAIDIFPNIESLMEFVESALAEDPTTLPLSIHDMKSSYHFFFKLKSFSSALKDDTSVFSVYNGIMSISKIGVLFDSEEKRRFLGHLIIHHTNILHTNAYTDDESVSLFNVSSMINHSCVPNVINYDMGDRQICETIRCIGKGEQLFANYFGLGEVEEDCVVRQATLKANWGFICTCKKCEKSDAIINESLV